MSEKELTDILKAHFERYPKMQPQDAVKLLYQNEFAGGHMIENETHCLDMLKEECANLNSAVSDMLFEDIGNNLARLHLGQLMETGINVNTVARFFVVTSNKVCGSMESFKNKLGILRQFASNYDAEFSIRLDEFLIEYEKLGFPSLSHSEAYRNAYRPHYRVVDKLFVELFELFCRIDELLCEKERIIVCIEGNSGAGKSYLASIIKEVYDCNVFHTDDYFLTPMLRTEQRLKQPGGNIDIERLNSEIISGILSGEPFEYNVYNCQIDSFATTEAQPNRLNIIEGVYSAHPLVSANYDIKVFLSIDAEEQSRRVLQRSGQQMHKRFVEEWIPLENKYFEAFKIKGNSDFVFSV